jgi:RNase H-fold protein (predicted Holliday junction resolvase)
MAVIKKNSTTVDTSSVKAKPQTVVPAAKKAGAPAGKPEVKAAEKLAKKTLVSALVPGAPEQKKASGDKRKRLSKAFLRPLDKKFKRGALVRDCFSFPEAEYAHLVDLKKRLLGEGVDIKKSELLRAGLVLLSSMDDEEMKVLLAKVPRITT